MGIGQRFSRAFEVLPEPANVRVKTPLSCVLVYNGIIQSTFTCTGRGLVLLLMYSVSRREPKTGFTSC
jgi:hypothetical protein